MTMWPNSTRVKACLAFVSERGQPMTRQAVNYIVRIAGEKAKLDRVWPHMLRHSCGFYLAGTDMRVTLGKNTSLRETADEDQQGRINILRYIHSVCGAPVFHFLFKPRHQEHILCLPNSCLAGSNAIGGSRLAEMGDRPSLGEQHCFFC